MTARRWAGLTVVALGLAWGLGGESVTISHGIVENHFLDFATGFSYFLGGAVAIDRRPGNRIGPLLVLNGTVWFCGNWSNLPNGWSREFLLLASAISTGLIAHLFLAYPSGRVTTRLERGVVVMAYAMPTALMSLSLLTADTSGCPCPPVPRALPDFPDQVWSHRFYQAYDRSVWVLVPLFLVVLVLRWRRSSPATRRDLTPLWSVALILIANSAVEPFTTVRPDTMGYLLSEVNAVLQLAVPWIFLYGLLSARLAQSAIGGLVRGLQSPMAPGRLRLLLAQTLTDPGVEVAYPVGDERWVDAEGRPVIPAAPDERRRTTVVERDGRPLAAVTHDAGLDPDLVDAAVAAAGMALDNERLHAELRAQLAEVRASRERIVLAGDAERRRLERDLHDGAQQRLLALSVALGSARRQLQSGEQGLLADTLERSGQELVGALQELRELARGIHPTVLTDAGLAPAVAMLAGRMAVPVDVVVCEDRLPAAVEATVYFVVSEALANITKHAAATRATVTITRRGDEVTVEVHDNGKGGADPLGGTGLTGLRDRVLAMGGTCTVHSPLGHGTTLHASVPWQGPS